MLLFSCSGSEEGIQTNLTVQENTDKTPVNNSGMDANFQSLSGKYTLILETVSDEREKKLNLIRKMSEEKNISLDEAYAFSTVVQKGSSVDLGFCNTSTQIQNRLNRISHDGLKITSKECSNDMDVQVSEQDLRYTAILGKRDPSHASLIKLVARKKKIPQLQASQMLFGGEIILEQCMTQSDFEELEKEVSSLNAHLYKRVNHQFDCSFDLDEEENSLKISLVDADGAQGIQVIKEIRRVTGLSLKESKEMYEQVVNGQSVVLKDCMSQADANSIQGNMDDLGLLTEIELGCDPYFQAIVSKQKADLPGKKLLLIDFDQNKRAELLEKVHQVNGMDLNLLNEGLNHVNFANKDYFVLDLCVTELEAKQSYRDLVRFQGANIITTKGCMFSDFENDQRMGNLIVDRIQRAEEQMNAEQDGE